jgi:hypothetical protein
MRKPLSWAAAAYAGQCWTDRREPAEAAESARRAQPAWERAAAQPVPAHRLPAGLGGPREFPAAREPQRRARPDERAAPAALP